MTLSHICVLQKGDGNVHTVPPHVVHGPTHTGLLGVPVEGCGTLSGAAASLQGSLGAYSRDFTSSAVTSALAVKCLCVFPVYTEWPCVLLRGFYQFMFLPKALGSLLPRTFVGGSCPQITGLHLHRCDFE